MPVTDSKFSNFANGGDLALTDIIVGLRNGINTRFNFNGTPGLYLPLSGGAMSGAIDMQTNRILNLPLPLNIGDAVNKSYADLMLPLTGGTMSGSINIGGFRVTNAADPLSAQDYATKAYVDASGAGVYLPLAGGTMAGDIQFASAIGLKTGTTAANTLLLKAYDTSGLSYTTMGTLTAGNPPTFNLNTTVTIGSAYIYRVGGTDVSLADGGTNASLTASNGGIFYSTSTAGAILAGTATASQMLQSGASGAPAWSTATWPATTTANAILFSSTTNTVGEITPAASSVLISSAGSVPSFSTTLPAGLTIPGYQTTITPAAMTKVDDTNVTLALGGSPTVSLLAATSLTLGWTGQLSVPRGGSGNSTFTAYSVICAGTTATGAFQNVSGVGASGQVLQSNGAGLLPTWATIPGATSAALTKGDDTNVTLTLAGAPSTALLTAASITAGWTGQLAETRGGTAQSSYALGDTLYASAANTLSKLTGNITTAKQYLSQTGSGAASAAPAWATISGADITGAALTKTDDTNVTLTLGGTPTTALLRASSLTMGWTGQLSLTRGGSNASLTASNGGIVYSTASAMGILSGTATAQQLLMSGASTTPQWSTTTYPITNAINTIMYASSANVLGVITPVNSAVMISSSGGVPSMSTTLPTGISATGMILTSPRLVTSVLDTNGNVLLSINPIASAANFIGITNAAAGGFPALNSTGSDAAVPFNLQTKNSNFYLTDTTNTIAPAMRWYNAAANHFTGLKIATAQATDLTLVLPATDATIANQAWVSDAAGNTSFGAVVTSGTYTPTLTNGANVAASTPLLCQYMRVGSLVTVCGIFNLDITTTLTSTVLGISLPIASDFTDTLQAGGVALTGLSGDYGAILSNSTNNNVQMQAVPVSTANVTYYFNFSYRIL